MPPYLKYTFKTLDFLAPSLAAKGIYYYMANPRSGKLRDFELKELDKARSEDFQFEQFTIRKYTWGKSAKKVLCVHGWEGQGANFGGIVQTLLDKGYEVTTYDGPSHGYSSKGKTNWFDYIQLTTKMALELQPDIIISHSFGSVATAAFLRKNPEFSVKQWFLITSPHDVKERIKEFTIPLGVTDRTIAKLVPKLEADTGEQIDNLNMSVFCADLKNVPKAHIVHGTGDKVLPIELSERIHRDFPQSELIPLDDLGHFRILWSEDLYQVLREKVETVRS